MAHQKDMQLAEILSDLVSLREGVCPPAAALALVSARPSPSPSSTSTSTSTSAQAARATDDADADLKRARDLVELHYEVRERCRRGELGRRLEEVRGMVDRAVG